MTTLSGHSFGIDIGGSGIKGAEVDLATGEFVGERMKIATPQPSTPHDVAKVVAHIVQEKPVSYTHLTLPTTPYV